MKERQKRCHRPSTSSSCWVDAVAAYCAATLWTFRISSWKQRAVRIRPRLLSNSISTVSIWFLHVDQSKAVRTQDPDEGRSKSTHSAGQDQRFSGLQNLEQSKRCQCSSLLLFLCRFARIRAHAVLIEGTSRPRHYPGIVKAAALMNTVNSGYRSRNRSRS